MEDIDMSARTILRFRHDLFYVIGLDFECLAENTPSESFALFRMARRQPLPAQGDEGAALA